MGEKLQKLVTSQKRGKGEKIFGDSAIGRILKNVTDQKYIQAYRK